MLVERLESRYYLDILHRTLQNIIGKMIKQGKKERALRMYRELLLTLKRRTRVSPSHIVLVSVLNSLKRISFIRVRFGSVKKEIPVYISFERQVRRAVTTWIKSSYVAKRLNIKRLASIILFCYKNKGPVIRQNYLDYRKAKDNRLLVSYIKKL